MSNFILMYFTFHDSFDFELLTLASKDYLKFTFYYKMKTENKWAK